jgi:hypothetical protein
MRLQTDLALDVEGDRIRARQVLHRGDQMYCSLSWAENLASVQDVEEANRRLDATTRYWPRHRVGGELSPEAARLSALFRGSLPGESGQR